MAPRMLFYHAGFVIAGFAAAATGAALARFMKRKTWWLKAHRGLASAGVALLFCGIAAAFLKVELRGGVHIAFPHAYLGAVIFMFALITPTLGLLQFRFRQQAARIRVLHRWSGRLLLLLLALNVFKLMKSNMMFR